MNTKWKATCTTTRAPLKTKHCSNHLIMQCHCMEAFKLDCIKSLQSNSISLKFLLIPQQPSFSYCKRSVGACGEDGRVPTAGSPTLAGERSHLGFCIRLALSSNKLLMSTHLFLYLCCSHLCHISQTLNSSHCMPHSDLLFWLCAVFLTIFHRFSRSPQFHTFHSETQISHSHTSNQQVPVSINLSEGITNSLCMSGQQNSI